MCFYAGAVAHIHFGASLNASIRIQRSKIFSARGTGEYPNERKSIVKEVPECGSRMMFLTWEDEAGNVYFQPECYMCEFRAGVYASGAAMLKDWEAEHNERAETLPILWE